VPAPVCPRAGIGRRREICAFAMGVFLSVWEYRRTLRVLVRGTGKVASSNREGDPHAGFHLVPVPVTEMANDGQLRAVRRHHVRPENATRREDRLIASQLERSPWMWSFWAALS